MKNIKQESGFSILIMLVLVAAVGGLGWFGYTKLLPPKPPEQKTEVSDTATLTPVIEAILTQKIKLLEELAQDPALTSAAATSTNKNKALSESEIKTLDEAWQSSKETDPFVSQFLTNKVAKTLIAFQEDNSGFVEIFVTDAVGLNVGQTNKTSDYLQADEEWWIGAYNGGSGKAYHGEIEYDESSRSESISLYVPIYAKRQVVVGILKGVLNITALQREL